MIVPEGYAPLPVDEITIRDSLSRGLDRLATRAREAGIAEVEPEIVAGVAWREIVRVARSEPAT